MVAACDIWGIMNTEGSLIRGTLVRRYKRFLADVLLDGGEVVCAHCPNTGRLTGCAAPGQPVALSLHASASRKYAYTWEMVHNGRCWVGIHTGRTNRLAEDLIRSGHLPQLDGYAAIRREVPCGDASRIDLLLEDSGRRCYVEVKNVTLMAEDGRYAFPDAVTLRGQKHLRSLMGAVDAGHRAAMLFVIQRTDGDGFRAAREIDPCYAALLDEAAAAGVEVFPCVFEVTPEYTVFRGLEAWHQ